MNPSYPWIAERAGHRCEYCHAPEKVFNSIFEIEHIIPVSQQGTDEEDNLALSCRACNAHKYDFLTGDEKHDRKFLCSTHDEIPGMLIFPLSSRKDLSSD